MYVDSPVVYHRSVQSRSSQWTAGYDGTNQYSLAPGGLWREDRSMLPSSMGGVQHRLMQGLYGRH